MKSEKEEIKKEQETEKHQKEVKVAENQKELETVGNLHVETKKAGQQEHSHGMKNRMKNYWKRFMHSSHNKLSEGAAQINKLITWGRKDNWRRKDKDKQESHITKHKR